jgi:predicted 3-demethylubiquinone-9 3-methyltransferase (glyoxalase superfamily)
MAKNTICLWYDKDAEAAARFYAKTFPDSAVGAVHRAPSDYPSGNAGDVLTVEFTVAGIPVSASTAVPRSSITKPSHSRSPPTIRKRPTARAYRGVGGRRR